MNKESAPQHNAQSPARNRAKTKGSAPLELSASEFYDHLKKNNGDLSDLCYTVKDPVVIGDEFKGYIKLGYGRFEGGLSFETELNSLDFNKSTIFGNLDFNESSISEVNFGEAKLHAEVSFGDLKATTIRFGNAEFSKKVTFMNTACITFNGGSATFDEIVHLGSLHVTTLDAENSKFKELNLGEVWINCLKTGTAITEKLEYPTKRTLHPSSERGFKGVPQINEIEYPAEELSADSLATRLRAAIDHYHEVNSPHK